jgi:hypothetical protein
MRSSARENEVELSRMSTKPTTPSDRWTIAPSGRLPSSTRLASAVNPSCSARVPPSWSALEGLKAATATTMGRIDVKACAARVMARSNTSTRTRLAMDLPASRPTAARASQPLT